MPKKIKEKERISLSLDKTLVHTLKRKAKENANNISQQAEQILQDVLCSEKKYLEYELKRQIECLDATKHKIKRYNSDKDVKELLRRL